jgi:tetratricopeptide (TPR) repeat protein
MIDEVAQGMWLSLGNDSPSSDPPLAKGTEAAFSPKLEQFPAHLESLSREDIQATPPLKEERIYDVDSSPPMEQSPRLAIATQNNKGPATFLQRLRISGKNPWAAMAMGIIAVLATGSFYVWVAPGKIPLSSAAEFTEMLKNATNRVKNLTAERGEEFMGMPKNVTSEVEVAPSPNEALPETLVRDHRSGVNLYQEIQNTTEPREDTNQSSQNPRIIDPPIQTEQQKQSTALSEVKPEESPADGTSPSSEIATLLAQAKQQIASLKLTTPKGDNAYESYTNILKIAPNHPGAVNGLQRIRDYYVNWGLRAENQQQLSLAATYYKRALNIFPDDSAIRTALHRVQAQRDERGFD